MRPLRAADCHVSSLNGVCSVVHDVNSVSEGKVDGKVTINSSLNKRSTAGNKHDHSHVGTHLVSLVRCRNESGVIVIVFIAFLYIIFKKNCANSYHRSVTLIILQSIVEYYANHFGGSQKLISVGCVLYYSSIRICRRRRPFYTFTTKYEVFEVYDLLLRDEERRRVCRNLDKSTDKVVDIHVTSQLSSAQRQAVVDQCRYHPCQRHTG